MLFDANANAVFPGSVVDGNVRLISQGSLKPVSLPLGNGIITFIHAPFSSSTAQTFAPLSPTSQANYTAAWQKISTQPFTDQSVGFVLSNFQQVYSSDQAKLAVGATFSGYGQSVSDFFSTSNSTTTNHVLFTLQQQFYAVGYKPNGSDAAAYFAPGVTSAQAQAAMSATDPPLVVTSVTYGASLYFIADSTATSSEMSDALNATASGFGSTVKATLTTMQQNVMNSMTIHTMAVGGRSSGVGAVVAALQSQDMQTALTTYVHSEINLGASPIVGYPVSYTLAYLDGTPAVAAVSTLVQPSNVTPETIESLALAINVTDNDKEKQTGVNVQVIGPDNSLLTQSANVVLSPANSNNQADYWNDNTLHTFSLPLVAGVPSYNWASTKFIINAPGDSWHATLELIGAGTDANGAPKNNMIVLPVTPNLFFNDGGDKNPFGSNTTSTYCFTLAPPDSSAQAGHCSNFGPKDN